MENRDIGQEVNLILASNSQFQDPHISIKFFLGSGKLTLWLCPELAQNSSGPTTGTYRRLRLRPLSTRRFGQPRRLGSRLASSPSGARAGGLSVKPCARSPAPLPSLLCSLPPAMPFPLRPWSCAALALGHENYHHDDDQMTSRMVILLCFCSFPLKFAKRHQLRNDQRSHAKSRFRSGIRSVVFSYTFQLALDQKPGSNSQI